MHLRDDVIISIHALREEGDFSYQPSRSTIPYFYPRPPRGGRRREDVRVSRQRRGISIHALREEGDSSRLMCSPSTSYFYPRPPRGGRRGSTPNPATVNEFLSTPSARRATLSDAQLARLYKFLSTPSARRATRGLPCELPPVGISIHALREEGDVVAQPLAYLRPQFLSTPSARRATSKVTSKTGWEVDFYPRPPRGGRPEHEEFKRRLEEISIHALREEGDASSVCEMGMLRVISIHALREEGDSPGTTSSAQIAYFYPRPPRGGRPGVHAPFRRGLSISIHALREEGDRCGRGDVSV